MKRFSVYLVLLLPICCAPIAIFDKTELENVTKKGKVYEFDLPNNWNVYKATGYHLDPLFLSTFPRIAKSKKNEVLVYSPLESSNFPKNKHYILDCYVYLNSYNKHLPMLKLHVAGIDATMKKYKKVTTSEVTEREGRHGLVYELNYSYVYRKKKYKMQSHITEYNQKFYSITYVSIDTLFQKYKPDANYIFSTFDFVK